jgi:hypothetical protein
MSRQSRRDFLQQSSALAAACWVGSSSQAWTQEKSANSAIRFACIGVDGKGASDRDDAGRHGDIVALCDIDEERLEKAALRFPKAKKYVDFRKMFDEMADGIDAVTVSTPDHTHAPASVRAMKLGKHTFCQKPLTHSVAEARMMRELAAEKKLCTQMGNQGTASGVTSVPSRKSTSGRIAPFGHKAADVLSEPKSAPSTFTGISSSALPRIVLTTRPINHSSGAAGSTSGPVLWATWPAIP